MSVQPELRKDGKKRRTPRLGSLPTVHNGLVQPDDQPRQNWHELVAAGPKGDPQKALTRAQRHAAARTRTALPTPAPVAAQETWHFDHTPNAKPGRLVLHAPRKTSKVDPRPTNKRLRYVAKLRRAFGLPA